MYKNESFLNYAFEEKITHKQEAQEILLRKQSLGNLYLPTGKIVANDPCVFFELDEFTITVAPGSYPVSISVAHIGDDKRVALAMLKFSDNKPILWEMAFVNDQDVNELGDDGYFGYGVDSGTGGFMDKAIADKVSELDFDIYGEFEDEFNKSYVHTYSYATGSITGSSNTEFVAFSSGYGDGCYPSYFGYDEAGEICALVTDFLVLE